MNNYVVDCNVLRKNDRIRSEVDVFVVLESDLDAVASARYLAEQALGAAQSELADLREELAKSNAAHEVASENHGLLNAEIFNLEQRLADAELRNSVLFGLLERWYTANCNDLVHVEDGAYRIVLDTNEALNKPEEAKSCCGQFPKCVCSEGADGL